jgi:hypothetical protein
MRTDTQPRWIGDRVALGASASDTPDFGWRQLRVLAGARSSEENVAWTLRTEYGVTVEHNGSRHEDFDLTIPDQGSLSNVYIRAAGLELGRYEVKSLWRASEGRSFDRRIKVGRRGERIYGRRDAAIKTFAIALEEQLDSMVDGRRSLRLEGPREPGTVGGMSSLTMEVHELVDRALERRHSKSFDARIRRLARAALLVPTLTLAAQRVLTVDVLGTDIVNGFEDIAGIFLVAGPIYTLVSQRELSDFLSLDSASSEGPRLRFSGVIPSETNKVRKEKGNESR